MAEIIVRPEQMRALARYEAAFGEYDAREDSYGMSFPERYQMTLADLLAALKNLLKANPTIGEFDNRWFSPLTYFHYEFSINEALGYNESEDDEAGSDFLIGLPLKDEDVFRVVWGGLNNLRFSDEARIADTEKIKEYIGETEHYLSNKDKTFKEREFTRCSRERFIAYFEDDWRLSSAKEAELRLCRKYTDELCEADSITALRLKGYACYGGNKLYECDWSTSRDCMLRLFELTDDPNFANTLGYIYYYGRCTGGVPEYEKAFEMFSIAAANGLHEALYKLADMYLHGYACKKSPRTAARLYEFTYLDALDSFEDEDYTSSFADAALRMGNVYLKGINTPKDPAKAYKYYLQADYAIKLRAERGDFYGDTTVASNIKLALESAKALLPEGFFKDYISFDWPLIPSVLVEDGYKAEASITLQEGGSLKLTVKRLQRSCDAYAKKILLTYPEINFCELTNSVTIIVCGAGKPTLNQNTTFKYDSVEWDEPKKCAEFCYDNELVCRLACEEFRLYAPNRNAPSGRLLTMASVAFTPNGRTYDYICELDEVKAGDKVIVLAGDGEAEVEVKSVYKTRESELALPLGRYKKLLRRA